MSMEIIIIASIAIGIIKGFTDDESLADIINRIINK
jgi:hypothetical protein